MVTDPVLHPSMASSILLHPTKYSLTILAAEFRGPGVRRTQDHECPDEYELDVENRNRGYGGKNGRIILLGDGTEVLTDSDDSDMFDHGEEDKDSENQVSKSNSTARTSDEESIRSEREGTPAPQSVQRTPSPSSIHTQHSPKSPLGVSQAVDSPRKRD